MSTLSPFRDDAETTEQVAGRATAAAELETWSTPFAQAFEEPAFEEPEFDERDLFEVSQVFEEPGLLEDAGVFGDSELFEDPHRLHEAELFEESGTAHPILTLYRLPAAIVGALSAGTWPVAFGLAVAAGYRDPNQMTNIVFYFRHPEVIGRKIRADERELAAEWVWIRDRIVKPALQSAPPTSTPAVTPAPVDMTSGAPVAGDALSSSLLTWPEASSPAELEFMKAVYDRHAERSRASGGDFVADLPKSALESIEGREARKDAAQAAKALLAKARAALAAEGRAGSVRIGITSAYRPATRQFEIWQGRTWKGESTGGGFPYYYREAARNGIVPSGNFGSDAVDTVAKYLGQFVASPGYSNHQDGLAFDFGTGAVGKKGLGKIGWKSWFRHWLEANARRLGFRPLASEAWHWTYHPPATKSEVWASEVAAPAARANRVEMQRVPLLSRHRGSPPDLILRWNDMAAVPAEIDVVVHLHGFWYAGMKLPRDIEPVSGLDLGPVPGTEGQGRSRPTLTVLPRAHNTGVKQKNGPYYAYTFPALVKKDGLPELVRIALERFAAEVGGTAPRVGRLILTAHSGGGKALLQILQHHDPHQVHVFDALYWPPDALVEWARRRIRRDRAALQTSGAPEIRDYMPMQGGALRVFYQDRTTGGTRPGGLALRNAIAAELGDELKSWYRVEASKYDHFQIPRLYGWRVLADASGDVPAAYFEQNGRRREFEEGEGLEFEDGFAESDLELEAEPPLNDLPEPVSEASDEELFAPTAAAEFWGEEQEHDHEGEEFAEWELASPEVEDSELSFVENDPELWSTTADAGEDFAGETATAVLDWIPRFPFAPSGGSAGTGKWVVLVAGFDYERKGVDFESIALQRMQLLIRRNVAAQKALNTPLSQVIDTAPRFVLFDFKSGIVRRSVTTQPSGTRTWTEIARFQPVTATNYSPRPDERRVFDTDQAGRLSITDVYRHVQEIGRTEPGSLIELSFLSHGWVGGPILVNSDDGLGTATDVRDPNDKDARTDKDFVAPTMDAAALANFQAAFDPNGRVWVWGCSFANSPRQVLHRVLSSAKYRSTAAGGLVNTDTIRLTFPLDHAERFFFVDPDFFPARGADGQYPLTFERTLAQIKNFFWARLSETYCQGIALAAQVPCFGALPGTYSDYERGATNNVMVVPTRKPLYADDFTASIRFYTTYPGVALDPEGRNYGRFDP